MGAYFAIGYDYVICSPRRQRLFELVVGDDLDALNLIELRGEEKDDANRDNGTNDVEPAPGALLAATTRVYST
jgi:hypothetical protein